MDPQETTGLTAINDGLLPLPFHQFLEEVEMTDQCGRSLRERVRKDGRGGKEGVREGWKEGVSE